MKEQNDKTSKEIIKLQTHHFGQIATTLREIKGCMQNILKEEK